MQNITIERYWADPVIDLYELYITCSNDSITAYAKELWASDKIIDELSAKIKQYSNGEITEFEWSIGNFEDHQASSVSIKVSPIDKFGYLHIQINMKIYDFEFEGRNSSCSTCIKTEIGLFEAFGKQITKLKQRENNIVVSLIN